MNKIKAITILCAIMFFWSCSKEKIENIYQTEPQKIEKISTPLKDVNENSTDSNLRSVYYKVKQYIFNRTSGANGLGHVGVGFEVRTHIDGRQTDVTYHFGSVENPRAKSYIPYGQYNGGWWSTAKTGVAMYSIMKNNYGYNRFKMKQNFSIEFNTTVNNGINELRKFPNRGYGLFYNNCLNATWDVLKKLETSYLINPTTNFYPNIWYNTYITPWSSSINL